MNPIRRLGRKRGAAGSENGDPSRRPSQTAREVWNVVLDQFEVPDRTLYAVYFHKKGSTVYYAYRHFDNKEQAEKTLESLKEDLSLPAAEFEAKHKLDAFGA
ncbi:MAG: hypothetical protein ACUVTZ_03565 [Armatimonadota bacterium]